MVRLSMAVVLALGILHALACPFTKVEESFNTQAIHDILFFLFGVDEVALVGPVIGANSGGTAAVDLAFLPRMLHGQSKVGVFSEFQSTLARFDHHEFPGVVPRTFTGAWVIAALSWPLLRIAALVPVSSALDSAAQLLQQFDSQSSSGEEQSSALLAVASSLAGAAHNPGVIALMVARMTLTICTWSCLAFLSGSLGVRFGRDIEKWFGWVCACQFHGVFYLGRPLPNTFALGLSALALGLWVRGAWRGTVGCLALCTLIFRCDTLLLSAAIGLTMLLSRETSFWALFFWGIITGGASLVFSAIPDSIMWRRLLWPEGSVLFFNTVLNKSSEWGIMPWHWYVTSALPRALLVVFPLAFFGALQPLDKIGFYALPSSLLDKDACRFFLLPAITYVALYSNLPHKEVRFMFQALPFFNSLAALALVKLERASRAAPSGKGKDTDKGSKHFSTLRRLMARAGLLTASLGLVASFCLAQAFFAVSVQNYPGAHALLQLQHHHQHKMRSGQGQGHPAPFKAHYCIFAAMSGISRFMERGSANASLHYSKQENPDFVSQLCESSEFDYLVLEVERFTADAACEKNYRIVKAHYGAPQLSVRKLRIRTEPVLYVVEKKT